MNQTAQTMTAQPLPLALDPLDAPALELAPIEARPIAAAREALPAQVVTPADLLRIAMQSGDKDIERLERLMQMDIRYRELQEQDRLRDAMLAFREDFARFRDENIIVPKTRYVERGKAGSFYQAEYDRVCSMLSPALSKHGFGFRHDLKFTSRKWVGDDGVERDIPWVVVVCYLEHRKGHAEVVTLEGPPGELTANTPIQNMQVSASYMKRQSLLAITGTATGGEDDEAAMRRLAGDGMATEDAQEQRVARQASVQEKFRAATSIPELARVMNALSMDEKKQFQAAFKARCEELKRGAQ
jgi:hypothetical protein